VRARGCCRLRRLLARLCLGALLCAVGRPARAEVYVAPRHPSKSNVRYASFEWKYVDILVKKGRKLQLSYAQGGRLAPRRAGAAGRRGLDVA